MVILERRGILKIDNQTLYNLLKQSNTVIKMHDITQQRIDESDIKIAETFGNAGISKDVSIVLVTMLQSKKPDMKQSDIANISGLPQGIISKSVNELIKKNWVVVGDTVPPKGRGRPTHIYNVVSSSIIVKDLMEHLKTYNETARANIAAIKETYK